jgi:hypothetical protein
MDLRSRIRFAFSKGLNPHEFKPRRREDEFILEDRRTIAVRGCPRKFRGEGVDALHVARSHLHSRPSKSIQKLRGLYDLEEDLEVAPLG